MVDFLSGALPPLSKRELATLNETKDVDALYSLPSTVKFCSRCVLSNQRPRITFDSDGVCSACNYWSEKATSIDWASREQELQDLCDRFRRADGGFDVLVPSSGGKDSIYVAHMLKTRYGMHPLTMTWSPHVYTAIGLHNFFAQIHAGLDNMLLSPSGLVHRRMCRIAANEMGDPFQPFIYGQTYVPLRVAATHNIGLIMDGENGEAEYGGDVASASLRGFSADDADRYWLSGFPLDFWESHDFSASDLELYRPPSSQEVGNQIIERHFFSYYQDWRPQEHYYYSVANTAFQPNPEGRSEGTYSKYASLDDALDPFHYFFALLKFGLGRATSDAAHEIREGLISRPEGVALVQRYDEESPSTKSRGLFREYTGFDEDQLQMLEEKWRNKRLWTSDGKGNFNLKEAVS